MSYKKDSTGQCWLWGSGGGLWAMEWRQSLEGRKKKELDLSFRVSGKEWSQVSTFIFLFWIFDLQNCKVVNLF